MLPEQVLNASEQVLYTLKDFESASRGYVITGDLAHVPDYAAARMNLGDNWQGLRK